MASDATQIMTSPITPAPTPELPACTCDPEDVGPMMCFPDCPRAIEKARRKSSPPELCPDCQRPKYRPGGPEDQGDRCESSAWRGPMTQQIKCARLTITRLRLDLATLQAKLDALQTERELEIPVVEAALEWRKWMLDTGGNEFVELAEMLRVVIAADELLAARAKAGR